jgi:hypothetical protein
MNVKARTDGGSIAEGGLPDDYAVDVFDLEGRPERLSNRRGRGARFPAR